MTPRELVLSLGEGRHNCPFCGGNNSLSILHKAGTVLWHCFRASCDARGAHNLRMNVDDVGAAFSRPVVEAPAKFIIPDAWAPITIRDEFVPAAWVDNCAEAYDNYHVKLYANRPDMRITFQSLDDVYIAKAVGHGVPKVLNVEGTERGFRLYKNSDTLVILEDVLSACNVWPFASALALLGTTLLDTHMDFVLRHKHVIICLDPDAKIKSLHMAKDLSVHVDTRVLSLTNDLKYFPHNEVESILKRKMI